MMTDKATYGEKYGPAMKITDQDEADRYFEICVAHTMARAEVDRTEAERIERSNLGYYAGYFDNETRARVERLFRCAHPVFGEITEKGPPTAQEAFQEGLEMGKKHVR